MNNLICIQLKHFVWKIDIIWNVSGFVYIDKILCYAIVNYNIVFYNRTTDYGSFINFKREKCCCYFNFDSNRTGLSFSILTVLL